MNNTETETSTQRKDGQGKKRRETKMSRKSTPAGHFTTSTNHCSDPVSQTGCTCLGRAIRHLRTGTSRTSISSSDFHDYEIVAHVQNRDHTHADTPLRCHSDIALRLSIGQARSAQFPTHSLIRYGQRGLIQLGLNLC